MTKMKFNSIIRDRWPDLFWDKRAQYNDSFTLIGNINTRVFLIFIRYASEEEAYQCVNSGDVCYEETLDAVIEYIEKNEDMIEFWLL